MTSYWGMGVHFITGSIMHEQLLEHSTAGGRGVLALHFFSGRIVHCLPLGHSKVHVLPRCSMHDLLLWIQVICGLLLGHLNMFSVR